MEEKKLPQDLPKEREKPLAASRKITRYLRELSVVVTGIAITFIISGWIGSWKEKKELEKQLEAVKTELEHNLEEFRNYHEYYVQVENVARYLRSDKPENLNPDSLQTMSYYAPIRNSSLSYFFTMVYHTNAMNLLSASGHIRLIKNPDLPMAIMDSYSLMERIRLASDKYMDRKQDTYFSFLKKNGGYNWDLLHPDLKEIRNFHSVSGNIDGLVRQGIRQIEYTLTLF